MRRCEACPAHVDKPARHVATYPTQIVIQGSGSDVKESFEVCDKHASLALIGGAIVTALTETPPKGEWLG